MINRTTIECHKKEERKHIVHDGSGADNHSPTRQMRVEFRLGEHNSKPTRQAGELFFSSLTYFSYFKLFSGLASENSQLLASMASVWKNLSTPQMMV
jgi:hypothetical protein